MLRIFGLFDVGAHVWWCLEVYERGKDKAASRISMREGTLHLAWPCWCIFCHSWCAFTPHWWRSSSIAVWLSCSATASHKLLPVTWFQCPQGRVHDICPIWEYIFSCFAHTRHVHRINKYTVIHNIKMHKSCLFSSCAYRLEVKFRKGILAWLLLYNSYDRLHILSRICLFDRKRFGKSLTSSIHHESDVSDVVAWGFGPLWLLGLALEERVWIWHLICQESRCCLHEFCNGFRMGTFLFGGLISRHPPLSHCGCDCHPCLPPIPLD